MRLQLHTPIPKKVPARALAQVCALLDRQAGRATGREIQAALAAGGFTEPVQVGYVLGHLPPRGGRRARRGRSSAARREPESPLPSGWPLPEPFEPFVDFVCRRLGIDEAPEVRMVWRSSLGASVSGVFEEPDQIRVGAGLSDSGTRHTLAHELHHLAEYRNGVDYDEAAANREAFAAERAWRARERPRSSTSPSWVPASTPGVLPFGSTSGPAAW